MLHPITKNLKKNGTTYIITDAIISRHNRRNAVKVRSVAPTYLKSYKSGEFIAMQGDIYRSLYILCNGTVRTQMVSAEGKQLTIETLRAPKLLAPAFIFASENRFPVNIETLETSEVLILNKDAFLEFMHQYRSLCRIS